MSSAENSANDSAQSPACSRNALPGGHLRQRRSRGSAPHRQRPAGAGRRAPSGRRSRSSASGQSGCCAAARSRHRCGLHSAGLMGLQRKCSAPTLVTWTHRRAEGTARCGTPGPRIGIFGGTFDPVHVGHLVAATWAREALGLDRVLLVVANVPWQKAGTRAVTAAEDRFLMVQAAVAGVAGSRPAASRSTGAVRATPSTRCVSCLTTDARRPALRDRRRRCGRASSDTWQRVDELRAVGDPGGGGSRWGGVGRGPPGLAGRAARHPGPRHLEQPAPPAPGRGPVRGFPHSRARHTLHPPAESVRWHQMSQRRSRSNRRRLAIGACPGGLTEVDVAVPAV